VGTHAVNKKILLRKNT